MMQFTELPWVGVDVDPPALAEGGVFIHHAPLVA